MEIIIIEIYNFIAHHTILHAQTCKRNLIWESLSCHLLYSYKNISRQSYKVLV